MKNNIYTKRSLIFLVIPLLLVSCKKYLTEEATTSYTADFVYTTPEGLETGLVGLYYLQRNFFEAGGANAFGSDPLTVDAKDDLTVPRFQTIGDYGKLVAGTTVDNSASHGVFWKSYYKIVDRANGIIKAAENLEGLEGSKKEKIIAEAKFFRAHSYFILFKLFNNIYITIEPTTPENVLKVVKDKTPETEIYKFINDDLTYAIDKLSWTPAEKGRINQGVARHVKAEVALWQKNWAEAKLQSEAVINSGKYALVANPGLVFKGDLNNSENLWVLQWKKGVNGLAYRLNNNVVADYGSLIPGSVYAINEGGQGVGALTMNNYIRDLLAQNPNDSRAKGAYYLEDYVYNDPATLPPGVALGSLIKNNPSNRWKEFAATSSDRDGFFTRLNMSCMKYVSETEGATDISYYKNIAMARLAETYLYAAEANLMLGDNTTALMHLNKVRNRAGTPSLTAITIESILDEQARELAVEGRRWYMLKRTGKLYDYIVNHAGYGKAGDLSLENSAGHANTPADPFPYKNDARRAMKTWFVNWVIPRNEMNTLGPNYPQNTGY